MAKNYYRFDLRLPENTERRVKKLLKEAREKTNLPITMNQLLVDIIEGYIADMRDPAVEEEK